VRGSLVINCLAKYGLQAEELANLVFFALSGNKQKFYKRGLHNITGLSLGEENILRSTSDIELTAVPVSLQYSLVKDVYSSFSTFDVVLFYTAPNYPEQEWYEGSSFDIDIDGKSITTYYAPRENSTLQVSYVEAETGAIRTKQDLVGDLTGTNKGFLLPNDESALGYYKVLSSGLVTMTQSDSAYPTEFATSSGLTASGIEQSFTLTPLVNELYLYSSASEGEYLVSYLQRTGLNPAKIGSFEFEVEGTSISGVSSLNEYDAVGRDYDITFSGVTVSGIRTATPIQAPVNLLTPIFKIGFTGTPTGLLNPRVRNTLGETLGTTTSGIYVLHGTFN
jgi:hypothetical protein